MWISENFFRVDIIYIVICFEGNGGKTAALLFYQNQFPYEKTEKQSKQNK